MVEQLRLIRLFDYETIEFPLRIKKTSSSLALNYLRLPEIHVPLKPREPMPFTITSSQVIGCFSVSSDSLEMLDGRPIGLARIGLMVIVARRQTKRNEFFIWKQIVWISLNMNKTQKCLTIVKGFYPSSMLLRV